MPDMTKHVDLYGVAAIRDWCNGKFLSLEEAMSLFACKLKIGFSRNFQGRTYTISNSSGESYTGTVPASLVVEQPVLTLNTTYTVTCAGASGTVTKEVEVGSYYGVYEENFTSFEAFFSCSSNANALITATLGSKTFTATADASGHSLVTVTEPGNYSLTATVRGQTTDPVMATVSTTGETTVVSLPLIDVEIVPWATGTDAQIKAMIEAAREGDIDLQEDGEWAVGDVRTITVGAFTAGEYTFAEQTIDIAISAFGDYMNCGSIMQFDFVDALDVNVKMQNNVSTWHGYDATIPKTTVLPALVDALPSWLSSLLIEFSVLASAGQGSSVINTVTGNKLALRSEVEIHGTTAESYAGEGSQVPYYTTAANRIKKKGHSGTANAWWCRSPRKESYSTRYCACSSSGSPGYYKSDNTTVAVAPFGCL